MSKNTDYCNAIAALLAEQHKIPRLTVGMTDRERGRINILRKVLHRQMEGLQQQAAKEFATLNGWRHSERLFSIKTLSRGGIHAAPGEIPRELYPPQLLDHPVYFREVRQPYRPAAVVGQPCDTNVDNGTELAHSLGLDLHAPPNPVASWWYPGWARFFCLTRPGVEVRFLPDQLTFEKHPPHDSEADTDTTMENAKS